MPDQKFLYMEGEKRLVAAARPSTGIPSGIAIITAASEDDHGRLAHLATVAFRESTTNSDRMVDNGSSHIKMLVIDLHSELQVTMKEFLPSGPTNPAIQVYEAKDSSAQYSHAHNYDLVVRILDLLDTDPSRVLIRKQPSSDSIATGKVRRLGGSTGQYQQQLTEEKSIRRLHQHYVSRPIRVRRRRTWCCACMTDRRFVIVDKELGCETCTHLGCPVCIECSSARVRRSLEGF